MKKYVGNGYYYVDLFGHFYINKKVQNKGIKKCLNNGNCIVDKEHLKRLFIESLTKDLNKHNVASLFGVTHDSFIDLIEHTGYETKIKIPVTSKANINELFKYWKCNECDNCKHKEMCFVCKGNLPDVERDEYLIVFKRKNNCRFCDL